MSARSDFIRDIVEEDLRTGRYGGRVLTRFPPEPNGYLHIGHAKSICLNFGVAADYGGACNLRFDDTNPVKEDVEYVESIQRDVEWLGFSYGEGALYASDYFEEMYALAEGLIGDGLAYVDDLSEDEIRDHRGSLSEPGRPSPYRDRPVDENLALFRAMRAGDFPDGACVLRARIDLAAANMKLRDPLLYRIRHATHHRTGDAWCIYPMYDWAHPLGDAIEGITHSICTLEFENNRPLYDWVVEHTRASERRGLERPHQHEFARLNLDYTVMSKRKLATLVEEGLVIGWDDPRMPTIAGMRRRGYRPEAIRAFAELIGVAKVNSTVDAAKLEFCVRDDLNRVAPRVLGVLDPLAVTLTTWPAGEVEELAGPYFPADVGLPGERTIPFGRHLLIDRDDFALEPPPGYQRLAPGRTVRLRHGYCITCDEVVTGPDGEVVELRCSHIPGTVGHKPQGGLTVAGVIHWVSAAQAVPAEVRLYDRLFNVARPDDAGDDWAAAVNAHSLVVRAGARLEPSLSAAAPGERYQLERLGYFAVDPVDSRPGALVLNRIVTLRDVAASARPGAKPKTPPERGPATLGAVAQAGKPDTRPARRSRAEYRAEARNRDPVLAGRFGSWPATHGLSAADADLLTGERAVGDLFEAAIAAGAPAPAVARWIINELPRALGERPLWETALDGAGLGALVKAAEAKVLTGPAAKEVLDELTRNGGDPEAIIAARGLDQVADEGAVAATVEAVLAAHADKVADYRAGKTALAGFFVGQVMRASGGKADPQVVQRLLAERL